MKAPANHMRRLSGTSHEPCLLISSHVLATTAKSSTRAKTLAKAPQLSSPGKESAKMALFVASYLKKYCIVLYVII